MANLQLAWQATRELGLGPVARIACYQLRLHSGLARRQTRAGAWEDWPLAYWLRPEVPSGSSEYAAYRFSLRTPRFLFDPHAELAPVLRRTSHGSSAEIVKEANEIRAGRFRLFGLPAVRLGFPPDWGRMAPLIRGMDPATVDLTRHWTRYDIDAFSGDVKFLWEPARFGWAFSLVRAYRLSGDGRYAEACWKLFLSWRQANLPNRGPHWISGQEVALRLMALCFAMHGLAPWLEKDPSRVALLAAAIAVHAARIPPTLDYARSQGNNHLLTEATALFTVGLLFPEFREASRWYRLGAQLLDAALRRQVFADGGYIQHSTNYHRLALESALWAASLGQRNGRPLAQAALDALDRLFHGLAAQVDEGTGRPPNFGPNDGAHILPLSSVPFDDYRPCLQAASRLLEGRALFPPGPWDEASVWLGVGDGLEPAPVARLPRPRALPDAGLHFICGQEAWAMLRCARFTSRPGHSDQLHVDLWRGGRNLALDAGTYLYNGAPPWQNALADAAAHNTLIVDGVEPMRRAGRFLWLERSRGRVLGRWTSAGGGIEALAADHDGYRRLGVMHRRTVVRIGELLWLIVDDVLGEGTRTVRGGWLLEDGVWRLREGHLTLKRGRQRDDVWFAAPASRQALYREGKLVAGAAMGGEVTTRGWQSPTYACLRPALRLEVEATGSLPIRMITWFAFDGAETGTARLTWSPPGEHEAAVLRVEAAGDRLDLNRARSADPSSLRRTR